MANHGSLVRLPTIGLERISMSLGGGPFADVGEDPRQGEVDHSQDELEEKGQKRIRKRKNQNSYGVPSRAFSERVPRTGLVDRPPPPTQSRIELGRRRIPTPNKSVPLLATELLRPAPYESGGSARAHTHTHPYPRPHPWPGDKTSQGLNQMPFGPFLMAGMLLSMEYVPRGPQLIAKGGQKVEESSLAPSGFRCSIVSRIPRRAVIGPFVLIV